MPDDRLERTRKAYAQDQRVFMAYASAQDRIHVWDGQSVRRTGLPPGQEERINGIVVRRGEIVK